MTTFMVSPRRSHDRPASMRFCAQLCGRTNRHVGCERIDYTRSTVARDPPDEKETLGTSGDVRKLCGNHPRSIPMKVKELMTTDVKHCGMETNLAAAAKIMWEGDCGAVPVIDERDRVVGVITDRDICIAAATRPRTEAEILVKDVISKALYTCAPGDDVRAALETMKSRKVRRLPVVGQEGRLAGIVSIHDIAVRSRNRSADVSTDSVLDAFIAITAPAHEPVTT
jgi:CBS domain-containing protein